MTPYNILWTQKYKYNRCQKKRCYDENIRSSRTRLRMIRSVNIRMCLQGYCRMRLTPSSEENQHQYTSTSNLEHVWWFVGILMGQIVFWHVGMMGQWLFWMDEIVMFKLLMMGQVLFSRKKLIGQWLFFRKKLIGQGLISRKKLIGRGIFFRKKWIGRGLFFEKNWLGGDFFREKKWLGGDFFWPRKTPFAPVIFR